MAVPAATSWTHAGGSMSLAQPRVMAVVNLTPDSFFDGGRWMAPDSDEANVSVVVRACRGWVEHGADLLDVGGESTRPGAAPVEPELELRRVLSAVRRLAADPGTATTPLSVDTRHALVARRCLEAGAVIVNDVSGLADPDMARVVAEHRAGLVIGHLRGRPADMQQDVHFENLLDDVAGELASSVDRAVAAGVSRDAIVVDPGIGFGKTAAQSAALTACGSWLASRTGCPVLIGASRKSFLGKLTHAAVGERMLASVVASVLAVRYGANIVRVHDVAETVEALRVAGGIADAWREHGGAS